MKVRARVAFDARTPAQVQTEDERETDTAQTAFPSGTKARRAPLFRPALVMAG
jgi:hypothetical protein